MASTLDKAAALAIIEAALLNAGPDVPPSTDARAVEASLRAHLCEPFQVEATVMPPGFPFADVGVRLSGLCLAHDAGYWLVYQPDEQRFLGLWGESSLKLGAHGVYGSPLYCWSA